MKDGQPLMDDYGAQFFGTRRVSITDDYGTAWLCAASRAPDCKTIDMPDINQTKEK